MEARYGKARFPREVGWWESQICRGRESRKAQGASGRRSGGSSGRPPSYVVGLPLSTEARGRRGLISLGPAPPVEVILRGLYSGQPWSEAQQCSRREIEF